MANRAEESDKIARAKKKLAKRIAKEKKMINKKALKQMKNVIRKWLSRHNTDRVKISEKAFSLFDENRHPAQARSKFVVQLLNKLKKEASAGKSFKKLAGRIKSSS